MEFLKGIKNAVADFQQVATTRPFVERRRDIGFLKKIKKVVADFRRVAAARNSLETAVAQGEQVMVRLKRYEKPMAAQEVANAALNATYATLQAFSRK